MYCRALMCACSTCECCTPEMLLVMAISCPHQAACDSTVILGDPQPCCNATACDNCFGMIDMEESCHFSTGSIFGGWCHYIHTSEVGFDCISAMTRSLRLSGAEARLVKAEATMAHGMKGRNQKSRWWADGPTCIVFIRCLADIAPYTSTPLDSASMWSLLSRTTL